MKHDKFSYKRSAPDDVLRSLDVAPQGSPGKSFSLLDASIPRGVLPLRDHTNLPLSSSPLGGAIQRCKGQWRDAGFWQKVISPGGSKTFKRRKSNFGVADFNKENLLPSTAEEVEEGPKVTPMKTQNYIPSRAVPVQKKNSSPPLVSSEEIFTDDWEAALARGPEDYVGGVQSNVDRRSCTLPRGFQSPLQRQSLCAPPTATRTKFLSPNTISSGSKSPYNFLKSRFMNHSSRVVQPSPNNTATRHIKTDSASAPLSESTASPRPKTICGPSRSSFSSSYPGYYHTVTGRLPIGGDVCTPSTYALLLSPHRRRPGLGTLPRAGLTQSPPTPPSPRRGGSGGPSSLWARLSASTKELQAVTAARTAACSSPPLPVAPSPALTQQPAAQQGTLVGNDVLIDWGEDGGDKKWNRKYSLPRHHQRQRPSDRPASDTEAGGSGGSQAASPEGGGDRVQGWAASFERLLEDPAGLHTFAEFLRKEYSHENIYFWTACERYRLGIGSWDQSSGGAKEQPSSGGSSPRPWSQWSGRHAAAAAIYNTHLGANAPEPVNVDSQARQVAQEGLHEPSEDLFAAAQKQVFNLMKFDSYSRFLKSALYQECVERETRGEGLQFTGEADLDPSLRIHNQPTTQQHLEETAAAVNNNNFVKGKSELEERRRRSLLPWARHKDRSKSKDRLNSATSSDAAKRGGSSSISKAKGLSSSAGRLPRSSNDNGGASAPARSNSSSRTSGRHPSDSSSSLGRASEVSGSRTSLNSGSDGILLMGGRKAISKESLTSSECLSLSGGEGGSGGVTGRCRVVLPDRSQSVVAVRSGVTVERVMRRLLDRRGLPFLAFNVMHAKSDKLVAGVEDSSALCGAEVRLQRLVLFRLDLPNQKTVCVKAKPHKVASDVLRPILAKYGFKLDLMHIHTIDDPRPINVKGPITDLDGQKFIIQTKEDVKEWGVAGNGPCCSGNPSDADALDAITNRVFEDLLHSKTSHQLLNSCDYDARSTKSGGDSGRAALTSAAAAAGGRVTSLAPSKDNDELYEGLKRAQMSRIEDQRGTKINSELPDFLKCDSENKENLVEMEGDDDLVKCFPEVAGFLAGGGPVSSAASAHYYGGQPPPPQQHPHHHHYHCQSASTHHHHHHLHTSQQQATPLRPDEMTQQPYIPHSNGSAAPTSSSIAPQQHSSSSLAQHQAHNFWSDISGGGSSIPSSLLATSSSSLSSSTGLPMSSTSFGNFDAIDTPLAVASSLLDMHYSDTIVPKLRPRPESCVNTRSDCLTRPEQVNRPKSSCGSLTAANSNHSSPDRTLIASPDLDETLSATPQPAGDQDRYSVRGGAFIGGPGEESHRHARPHSPSSRPHHLHHVLHHRHHHVHLHQSAAALDSIVSSSVRTNPSTSLSHTNINHSGSNVLNFSASVNHLNSVCGPRNCSSTNPLSFITRPMNTPSNSSNYAMGSGGGGSYFSTPPPPLPPKPKLGGPPRGPPPRPPSRQLPPAPPSHPPPAGDANEAALASASAVDTDAISFV